MKKQLRLLFFLLGLVFVSFSVSTNALAIENDMSYKDGQVATEADISVLKDNTDNSINPLADQMTRHFTFYDTYPTLADVPENRFYREFEDGYWWSGFLKATHSEKVFGGWKVTFSGNLYSYVE